MTAWILLLFTMLCAYITYDSFRWSASLKNAPFRVIENMWKGGLSHLSQTEQNKVIQGYSSFFGAGQLPWFFLAGTFGLAIFTARAFLE